MRAKRAWMMLTLFALCGVGAVLAGCEKAPEPHERTRPEPNPEDTDVAGGDDTIEE